MSIFNISYPRLVPAHVHVVCVVLFQKFGNCMNTFFFVAKTQSELTCIEIHAETFAMINAMSHVSINLV